MYQNDYGNKLVAALPKHLKQYTVDQQYSQYTAIDHAVWRYVMRLNYSYLKTVAYYPYIKGLHAAGLSIERIPDLQTMNDKLSLLGWGAVAVDGFIPPAVFMEFQQYNVLVIAADIRKLEHIAYTPSPDIIHESAGHAPIIADADYRAYLQYFGEIGAKAIISSKDYELYHAIKKLSDLKEQRNASEADILMAEEEVHFCFQNLGEPSEMAKLSRLHWWSVEYGLIGTLDDYKIYGAGLLSSIGESYSCMQPDVKKIVYDINAANQAYDITKPQPQLFVTPTFRNLIEVLEEFASTMAYRNGGLQGIFKAIDSRSVATVLYSSGLQVSGIFNHACCDESGKVSFIKTGSPTVLSYRGHQLPFQGKDRHPDGFSSPVGLLAGHTIALEDFDELALERLGVIVGNHVTLRFESGIEVSGIVSAILRQENKNLLISFLDGDVIDTVSGEYLFNAAGGAYDMAIGHSIVSVFNGYADPESYELFDFPVNTTESRLYDDKTIKLHEIYQYIRDLRNNPEDKKMVVSCWQMLKNEFSDDWLAPLDLLEILIPDDRYKSLADEIQKYLIDFKQRAPNNRKLIDDGMNMLTSSIYINRTSESGIPET